MENFKFISTSGKAYKISLPSPLPNMHSAFIFAFAKSGSTLLDNMITTYCQILKIPTFSLFNAAFNQGVPTSEISNDAKICFQKKGIIYTGFRHFPSFNLELEGIKCILLVRDPRDMLVSMYYSMTKSHVIPNNHDHLKKNRESAQKLNIDEFVISKASSYHNHYSQYKAKLPPDSTTIYKYEDVIYDKHNWLKEIILQLNLPVKTEFITEVARRFDILPKKEDESQHIRQVHPGNYRKKLTKETITVLNHTLSEFMCEYNYQ